MNCSGFIDLVSGAINISCSEMRSIIDAINESNRLIIFGLAIFCFLLTTLLLWTRR